MELLYMKKQLLVIGLLFSSFLQAAVDNISGQMLIVVLPPASIDGNGVSRTQIVHRSCFIK